MKRFWSEITEFPILSPSGREIGYWRLYFKPWRWWKARR